MEQNFTLHRGDCIEALRAMPDSSVDSVVTDPPYGLSDHKPTDVVACLTAWLAGEEYRPKKKGFMGRTWDSWVPGPEVWREVYRVLKPGGHVVAFAGSRTHDLMSMALRLAGFECRDTVMWVYGSGFPKSMDVSKAIDKVNGETGRLLRFTTWMRSTGLSGKHINEATGTFMGSHYLTAKSQPAIPTPDLWAKLRPLCGEVPPWVDELVDRIAAEREVVGRSSSGCGNTDSSIHKEEGFAASRSSEYDITAPATDAARQWAGWGTALKPAFEPALLFRKPLQGTVAENVLAHGTGALNISACRVQPDASHANPRDSKVCTCPSPTDGQTDRIEDIRNQALSGRGHDHRNDLPASAESCGLEHQLHEGSQGDCHPSVRSGDEPVQMEVEGGQSSVQQLPGEHKSRGRCATCGGIRGCQSKSYNDTIPNIDVGRFPANVIHDGSDEVLALFPDSDGAGPSLPRVKVTGYGGGIGSGESAYLGGERIPYNAGSGSAARFFYCPKASRKDRNEGCEALPQRLGGMVSNTSGQHITRRDEEYKPNPQGNHHPTVKPTDLMRYLCRLVTPPGGMVLDPFTGSGSTGKAAILEGFRFVGCELSDEYVEIAEARIRHAIESVQAANDNTRLGKTAYLF